MNRYIRELAFARRGIYVPRRTARPRAAACIVIAASVSFRKGAAVCFGDAAGAVAADLAVAEDAAAPFDVSFISVMEPDLDRSAEEPDLGVPAGLTFADTPSIPKSRFTRSSAVGFGPPPDASGVSCFRNGGATRARPPVCGFCRRIRVAFPGVIMCGSLYPSMIICMIFSPAVIGIVGK